MNRALVQFFLFLQDSSLATTCSTLSLSKTESTPPLPQAAYKVNCKRRDYHPRRDAVLVVDTHSKPSAATRSSLSKSKSHRQARSSCRQHTLSLNNRATKVALSQLLAPLASEIISSEATVQASSNAGISE